MRAAGVPTADAQLFDDASRALDYIRARTGPLVVKADGLALGKGVPVCDDPDQAARRRLRDAMERPLRRGRQPSPDRGVVWPAKSCHSSRCATAWRRSRSAACRITRRSSTAIAAPTPAGWAPTRRCRATDRAFEDRVMREVVRPTLAEMARRGTPFSGVLFAGLMVAGDRINVLEFNVRFGDPECETLMMRCEGDLGEGLLAVAQGRRATPRSSSAAAARSRSCSPRAAIPANT